MPPVVAVGGPVNFSTLNKFKVQAAFDSLNRTIGVAENSGFDTVSFIVSRIPYLKINSQGSYTVDLGAITAPSPQTISTFQTKPMETGLSSRYEVYGFPVQHKTTQDFYNEKSLDEPERLEDFERRIYAETSLLTSSINTPVLTPASAAVSVPQSAGSGGGAPPYANVNPFVGGVLREGVFTPRRIQSDAGYRMLQNFVTPAVWETAPWISSHTAGNYRNPYATDRYETDPLPPAPWYNGLPPGDYCPCTQNDDGSFTLGGGGDPGFFGDFGLSLLFGGDGQFEPTSTTAPYVPQYAPSVPSVSSPFA